jgi:HD-like signal output (HDOD) protein
LRRPQIPSLANPDLYLIDKSFFLAPLTLVLSHQIFAAFDFSRLPGFSFQGLWRHSMATGCFAKEIAQREGQEKDLVSEAFIAGILHDVGKLALASVITDKYKEVINRAREKNRRLWQAEKEVIGTTHAEVGGYLMGLWGMADGIVAALAFHHRPGDWLQKGFCPLTAVYAANVIEHEITVIHADYAKQEFNEDYLAKEMLGKKIPDWRQWCQEASESGPDLGFAQA